MKAIAWLAAVSAAVFASSPAFAASSQWEPTDGGRVRLIVESEAQPDGMLRGAIEIDLKPGWKTYWQDPGDAGIPPTIDAGATAAVEGVEIFFPVPKRFDDGVSVWAGYDDPVSLPVLFSFPEGASKPDRIEANVFLGVCEDICIPVDARFSVDLPPGATAEDAAVESAFAALPAPASEEVGIASASIDGATVTVKTASAGLGDDTELFVAAPPGWSFSTPKRSEDGMAFAFDILFRPKAEAIAGQRVSYVLVSGGKAVAGTAALPSP